MDEDVVSDSQPPASFNGRLKLQDFMFEPKSSPATGSQALLPLRRSSRRLTPSSVPASSSASASPSPAQTGPAPPPPPARPGRSPTPSKRKATTTTTTTASPSPSKRPRSRPSAGYAPPSVYAHLPYLPDAIGPNLLVLFVGLNPGIETARQGHAYAHPSNLFWKLLFSSGTTPRLVAAAEDRSLPALFELGLTNIVARPSRNGAELSKAEMDAGVALLEEKARRWRPEVVCLVGKGIWESVWRVRRGGRAMARGEFRYGWQAEGENMGVVGEEGQRVEEREEGVDYGDGGAWEGSRVFVASSTSGLAATLKPAEKEAIWRELGVWVQRRREERRVAAEGKAL